MSTDGLVTVWDVREVRDPDWWDIQAPGIEWLKGEGIPVRRTYRVEIYLMDSPFARVFAYAEDEQGRCYPDPATGEPAEDEPAIVPLGSLPPDELRLT